MADDYVNKIDLDGEQWDLKDSPLSEQVSNLQAYSETETNTSKKWTDNKPIYRKVIVWSSNLGTVTAKTTVTNAHGISNLDTVVKIDAKVFRPGTVGYAEKIPCYNGSSDYIGRVIVDNTNISITYIGAWRTVKPYVILEYTKTTD